MTKDSIDEYYFDAVKFIVNECMAKATGEASRVSYRNRIMRGGETAHRAKQELREAVHDYYRPKRPVRIDTGTAVVILNQSGKWVARHRQLLGYDSNQPDSKLYDYDRVCDALRDLPATKGERVVFLVNGQEVVGTMLRHATFATVGDALDQGVRLREISVLDALSRRWSDQEDKIIWGRAYIEAVTRLIEGRGGDT